MSNLSIDAAYRSSVHNECYIFVKERYVVVNYNPGGKKEKIIHGPKHISDGFPMLIGTEFEKGIDCAFDGDNNEAYIFSGKYGGKIDYVNLTLLKDKTPIKDMFPSLKDTKLVNGIDAGIRSTGKDVFLFKGDEYVRIDYQSELVKSNKYIRTGFQSLVGTVFEFGIDAAFASHVQNEAYIFKGDYYARINVAPGTASGDFIVGGRIKRIHDDWPALHSILKN
ncbi:albumin-2-like [Cicer arietinum]|uniref:Albumin-2-like n=1 Tax=Cicer arietinum TaxID=3827 RepID=A0A1S2XHS6_CICAR|nr:albumin-2-like [Cicer arietinum]